MTTVITAGTPTKTVPGGEFRTITTITLPTVWIAAGVPVSAANLGLKTVSWADVENKGGYVFWFDVANMKILAYRQTAATSGLIAVPDGTDITAAVASVKVLAFGK